MWPEVRASERTRFFTALNLLDVTPTLLAHFGLPIGEDMDGRVLTEIWDEPPVLESIPSWDDVEGNDGRHPEHYRFDPQEDQLLVRQLIELGYLQETEGDQREAEQKSLAELQFNLARSYVDGNLHADSIPILEKLVADWPKELRFLNQLAFSYLSIEKTADARRVAGQILKTQRLLKSETAQELSSVSNKIRAHSSDSLPDELRTEYQKLRTRYLSAIAPQHFLWACILIAEDQPEKALAALKQIPEGSWKSPVIPLRLGNIYICLNNYEEAEKHLAKALKIDPQNARALQSLMEVKLGQKHYQEAAEFGLSSIGLLYFNPRAHFQLGQALIGLNRFDQAEDALNVAISQNPRLLEAHKLLAHLYEGVLDNAEKRDDHLEIARQLSREPKNPKSIAHPAPPITPASNRQGIIERRGVPKDWDPRKTITVVSGLPRSGTSLMMQMLHKGGMLCLIDGVREADASNPKGYYECEGVKALAKDSSILSDALGRAIKITAPLVPHLPVRVDFQYRVIFIERDLEEVLRSQESMLNRLGKKSLQGSPDSLRRSYLKLLAQVNDRLTSQDVPTLTISYQETIASPAETAARLNQFCGGHLDEQRMADAVDASLHREKALTTD